MAKQTLEDFVKLYEDLRNADGTLKVMQQDFTNPAVYENVVDATKRRTGQDPRIALDPNTGRQTERQLSPYEIRRFLDAWNASSSERFDKYINSNLENVLKRVEDEKLAGLLAAIQPQVEKGYEEASKLHKEYLTYLAVLRGLGSKNKEEREVVMEIIRGDAPRVVRKRLEARNKELKDEDKMSDKEMAMWQNALVFIGYIPHDVAKLYERETEEKFAELKAKLGGNISDYLIANIKKAEYREKAVLYEALYKTIKCNEK